MSKRSESFLSTESERRQSLDFGEDVEEEFESLTPFKESNITISTQGSLIVDENNVGTAQEILQSMGLASKAITSGRAGLPSGSIGRQSIGTRESMGSKRVGRRDSLSSKYTLPTADIASHFNATAALLGVPEGSEMEEKMVHLQNDMNAPFKSRFKPTEMRQLALVAHNHMKPAMKTFIESHAEILKKFRITGTNTTMTMCRTVFGTDDRDIVYGATCSSGPLGGDAQLAALMVLEDIGGIIFFVDPLSAHPHQADIDSLIRLANVGNILLTTNPATAESMMYLLRCALEKGKVEMFPSFFHTLESPSVPEYKAEQARALQRAIES